MTFESLGLIEPLLRALEQEGYHTPTPIQEKSIPLILLRRDILGCAQTGTGKTAAFALPVLQLMCGQRDGNASRNRTIKALILTPTRELALQISESFTTYGRHTGLRNTVIFGGVSQKPQTDALRQGTDILVATPGRLIDLLQQGFVKLDQIQYFILDEADRMLDMGFVHDVKRVIARLPARRQSLFFSATMAPEILTLASAILSNPEEVAVAPVSSTADTVQQSVYFVDKSDKKRLLVHLLRDRSITSMLVFMRTKHAANRVVKDLELAGIPAEAIHGNKSQVARQRALSNFKSRQTRVLVATDIAARGIDIDELSHVLNYELPNIPETYVHRIGRTGRAGASGIAFSFCENEERAYLRDIQKLIGKQIPVTTGHPFELADQEPVLLPAPKSARTQRPSPPPKSDQRRNPTIQKPTATQKPVVQKSQPAAPPVSAPTGSDHKRNKTKRRWYDRSKTA
jgi:ATP-dependent RNA helicase RhlE